MRPLDHRVLLFELGGLRCGVRALDVQEICRAVTIVPLPKAPPTVEGVINYRGRVILVIDARKSFGVEPRALSLSDHLIVARAKDRLLALRVDAALGFEDVVAIEPIDSVTRGPTAISGVARLASGLVLIHDLDAYLSRAELEELDRTIAEVQAS